MNELREYQKPLLIAGGALVVAMILWLVLVAPQNSKLSTLQAKSAQLQIQEAGVQSRLVALQSEGMKLSSNCVDLQKISTQIPSVQSPTDIDAQESSFERQFNELAASSGVSLAQFSGFAPATTTSPAAAPASAPSTATSGVTAVPTTLTVQGNFGQVTAFINGLDSFPRLFVIQKFLLAVGTGAVAAASTSGGTSSSGTSSGGAGSTTGTPLWVGGVVTSPGAGPYSLQITGSIYYTSTPNALAACSRATAAQTTR
jgi:Tfp pilus assembly protein PilO